MNRWRYMAKRYTRSAMLLGASWTIAAWGPDTWLAGYASGVCAVGALLAIAIRDLKTYEPIVDEAMRKAAAEIHDDLQRLLDERMFGRSQ